LRSQSTHRARIIAANNILNALFMIVSAIGAGALLAAGATIPQVFLVTGLLNAVVAATIFLLIPEYLLRFVAFIATRLVYRFKVRGDEHIPLQGAAILVCNHVSFVDAVLLMAASPRPIRFIMDQRIFRLPVLGRLFRLAKAIPIASRRDDPAVCDQAFVQARRVLADGELLCIFPEGAITRDGQVGEFKGGIMKLLETNPVPVVPVALQNLWGSFFSRIDGAAMVRPFRRGLFSRVALVAGDAVPAAAASPALLRERVSALLAS
jgi:1-acyl-sn-glycerol-3-phosphate acyltransferase